MSLLPGVYEREFEDRRYLINHQILVRDQAVVLDRETRSPQQPDHWIEPGTVIVRRRGSGRFVHTTHPDAERNSPAVVTALQSADPAWAGTVVTASLARGLGFAVVLDPNAVDNASVIDQLNQNGPFAAHFLADEGPSGNLRVQTRGAGADRFLHVQSSLPTAFGPDGGAGHGRDGDYRVTDAWVDLRELGGPPIHGVVTNLLAGHFDESQLLYLTPEARVVLGRRGSVFG